ncbi:MAG: heparinase II/III family protein [Clostridia bacterium]|nr:heparinase II/III family protein [Clostridia bacterium]
MLDFAKDKKLWDNVRTSPDFARHRKEIKEKYDVSFEIAPRTMTASEVFSLDDHGTYFRRLGQLQSSALLALIYPDNEEYYNNLVETVWTYCNDYTWAPLGHYNDYYGVTPADYDIGLIDIFAASVAFSMAEIKNLFSERFPKLLKDRISAEIKRRTIEPFLTRKYFWEKHPNNWCAVCMGGVAGTLIYEAPDIYMQQIDRINSAMQVYIDSYADDGICVEGAAYWGFGFGFFVVHALLQRELTCGKYDWFKNQKVKAISTYIQKMFLQKNVITTFGDCNTREGYWIGLPHILRDVYGDEIEKLPDDAGTIIAYTHLAFSLRSVIYYKPEYVAKELKEDVANHTDGSCFLTRRTKNYGFATKGGNNGESHNHIDVGNFIVARNEKQIICDLGAGSYEEGYHGDKRYTFFHPSAESHNLPIFNGVGEDSIRRDNVIVEYDREKDVATLDITNAYGVDYVKSVVRKFTFAKNTIKVTDHYDLANGTTIKEHFISTIEPKTDGKYVLIEDVRFYPDIDTDAKVTVVQAKSHFGYMIDVYCIDYELPVGTKEFTLTIETPSKK